MNSKIMGVMEVNKELYETLQTMCDAMATGIEGPNETHRKTFQEMRREAKDYYFAHFAGKRSVLSFAMFIGVLFGVLVQMVTGKQADGINEEGDEERAIEAKRNATNDESNDELQAMLAETEKAIIKRSVQ